MVAGIAATEYMNTCLLYTSPYQKGIIITGNNYQSALEKSGVIPEEMQTRYGFQCCLLYTSNSILPQVKNLKTVIPK